jgi:PAS domain S-box-containing protein
MPEVAKQTSLQRTWNMCRSVGALSWFVLINGLAVSAIVFVVLLHEMADQKNIEARKRTREAIRVTEKSIADNEKVLRTLGYFYASRIGSPGQKIDEIVRTTHKHISADAGLTHTYWVTEKNEYRLENIASIGQPSHEGTVPPDGWPSFAQLLAQTSALKLNETTYLSNLPWLTGNDASMNPSLQPAGLVVKINAGEGAGTTGIFLAVTTPAAIFGKGWAMQRDEIARILVTSHFNKAVVFDSGAASAGNSGWLNDLMSVRYALRVGETYWDLEFLVFQTPTTRMLTMAPWIALFMIASVTLLSSFLLERKRRQDNRLVEMSRTLAGAHHELQNKISERDHLFHALRKSEREYKAVINSVSDVIFETDETGRITLLNETWKRVTENDITDYIGRSLFDVITLAERRKQQDMFEDLVRGDRQSYRAETMLDLGGGRHRAVEIAFSMLRMTEDKSLRVVGTITDIEKRRRAELAMREAEQRFRAMFENSISGIYQTSPDGRFISANPALAEILGYTSTEDMILSVTDIATQIYVTPEDRNAFVQKVLFEGRVLGIEAEMRRKDGTRIWIMENARVVRSPNGGVQYYEGSIWDVTERKHAEETMRQARIQAEMSSRARMEFLANMSHELRTPLNAIIGFSEIIKDEIMGEHTVPVYKEYAKDIYESGNYLLKVISEILEVSKIETGNRELNQRNFMVMKAVKSCIMIMASRIEQAGIDIRTEIPAELPEILAEELGFKQIMLNLIGNAIKFTEKGGKVIISARVNDKGAMEIDITDTGIGMTEAEIRKALQPFGKVDNNFSTMKEGTGLGLTIVESLVTLHGGKFSLLSDKGAGTTARITLPSYRVLQLASTGTVQA